MGENFQHFLLVHMLLQTRELHNRRPWALLFLLQLRQGEESAHSDHRWLPHAQQQPHTNTQADGYRDDDLMGVNLDDPFWQTVQSNYKRKGENPYNRPTTPISAHPQSHVNHPGPRVQPQRPAQHSTQYPTKSQAAPGVTRTAVIPTFTKQFTKSPAPLTPADGADFDFSLILEFAMVIRFAAFSPFML